MGFLADKLRAARVPRATAVIAAGGTGTRFGGDKLMAELDGMPVLARTLMQFEAAELVSDIVVVTRPASLETVGELCKTYGISKTRLVVPGGQTRLLSVFAGVMAAENESGIIAIHDAARPLVTQRIITDAVWAAYRHGAAVPGMPVRDTIKAAEDSVVTDTPDRKKLFAVQTPQCFRAEVIRGALTYAVNNHLDVTDDCMAVERVGGQIYLTAGSEENIKITTPQDLAVAALILERRAAQA